ARSKHLRVQVIGPAAYQPGTTNPYRLWVTDVAGRPADAPLTARLVNDDNTLVLPAKGLQTRGEWSLQLPANLPLSPENTPRLEIAAGDPENQVAVRTHLRVLEAAYRTHLVTDKLVYRTGDTIYFRSLTLERFGLKAPQQPLSVTYTLTDGRGKELQTLREQMRPDGIGGG